MIVNILIIKPNVQKNELCLYEVFSAHTFTALMSNFMFTFYKIKLAALLPGMTISAG